MRIIDGNECIQLRLRYICGNGVHSAEYAALHVKFGLIFLACLSLSSHGQNANFLLVIKGTIVKSKPRLLVVIAADSDGISPAIECAIFETNFSRITGLK